LYLKTPEWPEDGILYAETCSQSIII
jgi:hypothetical protein